MNATADRGAIQIGWVTRLAVFVAVVGVFGFDGFSILSARVKGEDDAQNAATAASAAWQQSHNITAAYQAAEAYAEPKHETVLTTDFTVDPNNTVHLLLQRKADTLVVKRIGPLRKYTVETLHGDADSNPP